jgi:PadR family transcriptional regulator PadR
MPSLQHFELQILLALVRAGTDTYSVPLVALMEEQGGKPVAPAAVFIALTRLEKKGLVASHLDIETSARPRRYFRLTRSGRTALKTHQAEYARLWQGIDRLLDTRKA